MLVIKFGLFAALHMSPNGESRRRVQEALVPV